MVWSSWKLTPLVLLLWAGLAWCQQPPRPLDTVEHGKSYLSIDEVGKPSQKCLVLQYWQMPSGDAACQVQALDTGEIIVIVDPPAGSTGAVERQIYRWGDAKTCPEGFPAPPAPVHTVSTVPVPMTAHTAHKVSPAPQFDRIVPVPSTGSPYASAPTAMPTPMNMMPGEVIIEEPGCQAVPCQEGPCLGPPCLGPLRQRLFARRWQRGCCMEDGPMPMPDQAPPSLLSRLLPTRQVPVPQPVYVANPDGPGQPLVLAEVAGQPVTVAAPEEAPQLAAEPLVQPRFGERVKGWLTARQNRGEILHPAQLAQESQGPAAPHTVQPQGLPASSIPAGPILVEDQPVPPPALVHGTPAGESERSGRLKEHLRSRFKKSATAALPPGPQLDAGPERPALTLPPRTDTVAGGAAVIPGPVPAQDWRRSWGDTGQTGPDKLASEHGKKESLGEQFETLRSKEKAAAAETKLARNSEKNLVPPFQPVTLPADLDQSKTAAKSQQESSATEAARTAKDTPPAEEQAENKQAPLPPPPASKTETARTRDPLSNPGPYSSRKVKEMLPASAADVDESLIPPGMRGSKSAQGRKITRVPVAPPGTTSVLAANSGLKMPVKYVPYPVVTMPQPAHPPVPPAPQIPQPPLPNMYGNAFTPPPAPNQPPVNYPPQPPMRAGGYPPLPNPAQLAQMYAMMQMARSAPPGMPQMPQMPQMPMPGYAAQMYSGPTPPNMAALQQMGVAQAGYQPGYGYPAQAASIPNYANPAMDRPGLPVVHTAPQLPEQEAVYQLLTLIKTATAPSQREWAIYELAKYDWHRHPLLVNGLLSAAREDPAATVRLSCVNTLIRMQVSHDLIAPTLEGLRKDVDPRVQQAVNLALPNSNSIQPASATMPSPAAESKQPE